MRERVRLLMVIRMVLPVSVDVYVHIIIDSGGNRYRAVRGSPFSFFIVVAAIRFPLALHHRDILVFGFAVLMALRWVAEAHWAVLAGKRLLASAEVEKRY